MNNQPAKPKIFFKSVKIAVWSVFLAFFLVTPALAQGGFISEEQATAAQMAGNPIGTADVGTKGAVKLFSWQNLKDNLKKFTWDKVREELRKSGALAFKAALKNFLNTLAYDMATYLATGDKGQLPMFQTQGWGGYLSNVADNSAGAFIEALGKEGLGGVKFNLCSPNLNVMLRINFGLLRTYRPKAPACTFSQLTKNWDAALRDKDFLPKFQDMFNPWSNDLGIALTVQTGLESKISQDINAAVKDREEGKGFKSVTDAISGAIKTPGSLVRDMTADAAGAAKQSAFAYTGSVVADSIDIFINTLAGKLIENWLRKGLVTKFPNLPNKLDDLAKSDAQNRPEGAAEAKDRMKSLVEPNFKVRADYDILAELATCPDPNKAGPTDCVIDEKFRQAIEKKMTVGQALAQGYLNGNGVFGFTADGLEPKFNEGYPYRSMLILRKYRIIPVGWEVAAQKIKDLQGSGNGQVNGTKNLKNLVDCFNGAAAAQSWCAGLVDPDWVLKAPQNFCKKEGAGPEIISEQVTGQGTGSSLAVLRDDGYCADEQSVITEKSDGSPVFGYCTEERRKWDFNARGCEPRDNTCQTFSSSSGQTNSYLENTLDFTSCNLGNAGCKKYATAGDYNATSKTIAWDGDNQPIYLNKQAETCDASSEGCHAFIRITPGKNETYDTIEDGGVATAYERIKSTDPANSLKAGLIHEKLLPDYLINSCYTDRENGAILDYYKPVVNAPAQCANFARRCKEAEVGCELYTSLANETEIPAKVAADDYCPLACVGYNSFIQSQTVFDDSRDDYFIPRTAKTCSASAAGCDQFTNLDEVKKGGEGIEYWTSLRQCIKKSDAPADGPGSCAEFYNWEGSDESGYQLKVESLQKTGSGLDEAPVLTQADDPLSSPCNKDTYNLPSSDPAYNADCRQFYNRAGGISYHLYSRTIACSDDCHPYRRTEINELTADDCRSGCSIGDAACLAPCNTNDNCSAVQLADKKNSCKQSNGNVVLCKSGGIWSADNNACLYLAVPNQGLSCSAQASGCREYTGNTGNNLRIIFTDDFEADTTTGGWQGVSGLAPERTNVSILLQNNVGHSMLVKADAKRIVGSAVTQGKSYILSFLARAAAGTINLDISLVAGAVPDPKNPPTPFAPVKNVGADWQIYKTNLISLDHKVTADEFLLIEGGNNFYIDNINLTEITDRYYLLKNSWRTPASCDQDLNGAPSPLYMLGCDQYKDRAGKAHNLKQFSKLCHESAVGCELMIDTKNSSAQGASYYKDGQAGTAANHDLTVPADDFAYVAYDAEKLCGAEEKGCELLGQSYQYGATALYGDVYLKNNPDNYGTILCGANAVGCEAFAYDNGAAGRGEKYFKDPGQMACEWRLKVGAGAASEDWYKKKVKRCDINSDGKIDAAGDPLAPSEDNVCLSDSSCSIVTGKADVKCDKDADCGNDGKNKCVKPSGEAKGICHKSCLIDNNDYKCPVDTDPGKLAKTLGLGGAMSISQPSFDANGKWAGICAAADSGCTEYIDPLSRFNTNLIFNGSFQTLAGSPTNGWQIVSGGYSQNIILEPNMVYRLAREIRAGDLKISACAAGSLYKINSDNRLDSTAQPSITVEAPNPANSQLFYYKGDASASCTVTAGSPDGAVELKKVVIDYQLAQNLDRQTCNGLVNSGQGCVLFNERKQAGAGLAVLNWDADGTMNGLAPANGTTVDDKDSNIILKVAPDRVCDKWLACKSYIKDAQGDNVCFDIGLCDAVDGNGNCQSFISSKKENQLADRLGAAEISNLSGYAKVGIENGSLINDYYPLGAMEQKGEVANLSNGSFEYYGSNLYPIGWTWGGGQTAGKSWNTGVFSVINNPISAQTEGIGYAPEGAAFLKLGSSFDALSEPIDVIPNTPYIITAHVNTKNLKSGEAKIDILNIANGSGIIQQALGNGWKFQMGKFTTGDNSQIQIKLYADLSGAALASSEGNFYFDGIKIRPALNSRIKEGGCFPGYCVGDSGGVNGLCSNNSAKPCKVANDKFWYAPQSCRLYPQSDSLACDYYEDSGKRQKGWPGYCLEYDRRPGDPNTCLLWYPIDKVKGDGIEEGAGYAGKAPVYYCSEGDIKINIPASFDSKGLKNVYWTGQYSCHYNRGNLASLSQVDYPGYIRPGGNYEVRNATGRDKVAKIIENNYDMLKIQFTDDPGEPSNYTFDLYDLDTNEKVFSWSGQVDQCLTIVFTRVDAICTKLVKTVNEVGNNKYWSSRVYKGSDYPSPCKKLGATASAFSFADAICDYTSNAAPFGSIIAPGNISNPFEWDSSNNVGIQPLSFIGSEGSAGVNYYYSTDKIKNLFAQSYGIWDWIGTGANGRYTPVTPSQDWGPPGANNEPAPLYGRCSGATRELSSDDYCAIPPKIENVKVNGSATGPITLTNSQFVKLSFNTKADSQQLPLVMYGVDWGDGSNTMVTGAEMYDKPAASGLEEIIYHLYSYWDLKGKANSGNYSISINCSAPGECRVKPKIQIKDNWGWCSAGKTAGGAIDAPTAINDCNQWEPFGGWVVVKEK